ncbi:hypothetical protein RS130_08065 [Paraglaciecola aquimarina]|uniref:Uncharacterized protein n=1 Tax=Paraglaciecola aquimarina TaxID=1235557 RepID=A0ABU3SV66_9ALTE|nr:hypothetical protein [Paraglaciecola aquimarina]MDU0353887.1 hypothetical protein [Paraglaciecola aquimarina]
MARLFVSLYVFITLALICLSAGLDRIFFSQNDTQTSAIYIPLLQTANQHNIDIEDIAEQLGLEIKQRQLKDLAWSSQDLTQLEQGQVLRLVDAQLGEQLYLQTTEQTLVEISFPAQQQNSMQFFLYSIFFFLSLGVVIALWIWPLWRDLSSLQKTVSTLLPDGSIAENQISKHSLIAPIAQAINNMRSQISDLMQNQRELSGAVAHEFRTP